MSETTPSSVYAPLDHSKAEIRLIHLQPHSSGSEIECSLHVTDLDDTCCGATSYEAISYEWGVATSEPEIILLNNTPFPVRSNLSSALGHLRHPSEIRVLWIDALCINQEDQNERNFQVQQMGRIYQNASRVIAWLGLPGQPDSINSLVGTTIQEGLSFAELLYGTTQTRYYWSRGSGWCQKWPDPYAVNTVTAIKEDDARWGVLHLLFRCSYFQRLWIVQELVLASDIVLQSGVSTLAFKAIEHICSQLNNRLYGWIGALISIDARPDTSEVRLMARTTPFEIYKQRVERKFPNCTHTIFDLCYRYREANCSDLLDKIYGLLGMSDMCCRQNVKVDYSSSPAELCLMIVEHQLLCHNNAGLESEDGGKGSSNLFLRYLRGVFALFQHDSSSRWQHIKDDHRIFFSGSDFSDETNVAMLDTTALGQIMSFNSFADGASAEAESAPFVNYVNLTTDASKVELGDLVHQLNGQDMIVLRLSGVEGRRQLVAQESLQAGRCK